MGLVTVSRLARLGAVCWLLNAAWLYSACSSPPTRVEPEPPPPTPELPAHCTNEVQNTTESDVDCGGFECQRCAAGRKCVSASDCASGQCAQNSCQDPSCANERPDSGETDLDCGGRRCRPCESGRHCKVDADCTSGVCADETCAEPSCSDGHKNGGELDVDCGGDGCPGCRAGTPCSAESECASGRCLNGKCDVECGAGSAECDGDLSVECEVQTTSDPSHCGACGALCALDHAEPSCVESACAIAACEASYADCNADVADGCETNLDQDADHCGACDFACPRQNATPSCVSGVCALTCEPGFGDCDRDAENGCETALDANLSHCGGCNRRCTAPSGETALCSNGQCGRAG